MTAAQRRITLAICVIVGLTLLVTTGLTFLVEPMSQDLGLSDSAVEDLLVIPALAALLVVFVAGRAGDRIGQRSTMLVSAVIFTAGSIILATAGGEFAIDLGLCLCGAGAVVIQVVALSLLQQTASEGRAHVSAFTTYGMVFPFAFLVLPIATAGALGFAAWRWIPFGWAVAGVTIMVVALVLLDRESGTRTPGEWSTPLLAGISLAAGSLAVSEIDDITVDTTRILVAALISVVAAVAGVALARRSSNPGLSLAPLRGGAMRALMIGVVILSLVQLLTYLSIFLEYFYDMTALQVSLIIAPAQVGAIAGAKILAGAACRRWGVARSGQLLMLATGVTMLPLAVMQVSTPVAYVVLCATVFSFVGMAALTVLNMDIMGRAPAASTGAVSALRTAASSIGTALGMAILGAVIISSVQMDEATSQVDTSQLEDLAMALRIDGVVSFLIATAGWLLLRRAARREHGSGVPIPIA